MTHDHDRRHRKLFRKRILNLKIHNGDISGISGIHLGRYPSDIVPDKTDFCTYIPNLILIQHVQSIIFKKLVSYYIPML